MKPNQNTTRSLAVDSASAGSLPKLPPKASMYGYTAKQMETYALKAIAENIEDVDASRP